MNLGKENEMVEFKESLAQLDKGLKSLTAMLNKHHAGTVYFGVNDKGDVVGTSVGEETGKKIRTRIKELVDPDLFYKINFLYSDDGKTYIELTASGSDTPYSCDGRYYIRNEANDDSVSNNLLRRMLVDGGFDILKERKSPNQKLTFISLREFLEGVGVHSYDATEFYQSLKLYNSSNEFNMTAFLLSDQNDYVVKVVTFAGNDKSRMVDKEEFGHKCLLLIAEEILSYFRVYNKIKVDLSNGLRVETPLFDYESFREALINALVHNAWAEELAPSIFIYDDFLEISSYGELPYSLSLDDFYIGKSVPVNVALFNVFLLAKMSEQTGHGVRIITSRYGKEAYTIGNNTITVKVPFAYLRDEALARRMINARLKRNERNVLDLLSENPSISIKSLSEALSLSESGVKKVIQRLVAKGLVKREGSNRNGRWMVAKL